MSSVARSNDEIEALQTRVEILKRASISAYPNPIQVDGSGIGVTTISYTFLEGCPVEIHVGSPNGPLFSTPDKSGKAETGKWVLDGTKFFLQDVSDGRPLTDESTLATVTVRVSKEDYLAARLNEKELELKRITDGLNWRLFGNFIKQTYVTPVFEWLQKLRPRGEPAPSDHSSYVAWAKRCEEFRYNSAKASQTIETFAYRPTVSIIMPVYDGSKEYLTKALDSVRNQYYPFWELCICDDGSNDPRVVATLKAYAGRDQRIKLACSAKNEGIVAASNHALDLATGDFVGFLDHDDVITPDALYEVVKTLQKIDADLIYSDEDKLDADETRCEPFFKPAWSPDLLLSCNYICHFAVYRRSLIVRLGGLRDGFEGSQDYDLVLRSTEKARTIVHIPKILYHWRKASTSVSADPFSKPYAHDAAKRALQEALARQNMRADVIPERYPGFYRVRRNLESADRVSIIIPTRDRLDLLKRCVDSIERFTDYQNYEVVIIDNHSEDPVTLDYLKSTKHRVIHDSSAAFNFARLNNQAAQVVDGKYLVFLNNDIEVIRGEWLSAMIEHAQRPEVGAVGAKLLYPDDRIQHGGVVLGIKDVAGHSHKYRNGYDDFGYVGSASIIRNYSAVTGACMMVRRTLFADLGGFDELNLPVAYNDIDFCLRLRRAGYLIVFTPYALLYHKESASRGYRWNEAEVSYMMTKWRNEIFDDPFYSPNLTRETEDFAIDFSKPEAICRSHFDELPFEPMAELPEEIRTARKILIHEKNFCGLAIDFGESRRVRKGSVRLHLRKANEPTADARIAAVNASSIEANKQQMFVFDPLLDSAGTIYYFFVEYVKNEGDGPKTQNKPQSYIENPLFFRTASFSIFCERQFRIANSSNAAGKTVRPDSRKEPRA